MDNEYLILQYIMQNIRSKNPKELKSSFLTNINRLITKLERLEYKVLNLEDKEFQKLIMEKFTIND